MVRTAPSLMQVVTVVWGLSRRSVSPCFAALLYSRAAGSSPSFALSQLYLLGLSSGRREIATPPVPQGTPGTVT